MPSNFGTKAPIKATALPRWSVQYHSLRASKDAPKLEPGVFEVNPVINEKIALWRGDITALEIDGIVNAANSDLWAGGGICGAIHRAAGSRLEQACDKIGSCPTGNTVITPGFKLPSKYVLHSVGPTNKSPDALESCYRTIMECCVKHKVRSVCMCCISTGIFGFPNEPACIIALSTVRKFLENPENQKAIDLVVFCTFMIEDVKLYDQFTPMFFPVERVDETADETEDAITEEPTDKTAGEAAEGKETTNQKTEMTDDVADETSRKEGSKRSASVLTAVSPPEKDSKTESKSPKLVPSVAQEASIPLDELSKVEALSDIAPTQASTL